MLKISLLVLCIFTLFNSYTVEARSADGIRGTFSNLQRLGDSYNAVPQERIRDFPTISLHGTNEILVDRETWFDGAITITDPNNPATDMHNIIVDIRGRGNSTWFYGEDKRPLRFRFNEPIPILHFEHEARTWVMLANHFDHSLMRNFSALYFASLLEGMYWTPVQQFVHLYFNDEYMGLYQITDERDIGDGRARLTLDHDPTISEFFLELDWRAFRDAEEFIDYVRVNDMVYDIRFPSGSMRSVEHGEYVYDFLSRVSYLIREGRFDELINYIDIDSFVDFYIVQELFANMDSGMSSVFMQIMGQGEYRRLYKGPVWDFDLSSGNVGHVSMFDGEYLYTPEGFVTGDLNYWYRYLLEIPEFRYALQQRWAHVLDTYVPQVIAQIEYISTNYYDAFLRNFERHDVLGTRVYFDERPVTTPAMAEISTFMGHVEYLIAFLEARAKWLDMAF